ncbi:reverse transcriptase domain-containing protein [Tanacetum coccineum]|uniref:Reverse transcriptase domain-containing protein n=1 Tax=Tanacetum coccineum TaxID=301880 RepID=A0ABQ4ZFK6_9ASTR
MQTVTLLKNDFKKEESKNIDREIALEKRIKQLDKFVFKRDQSTQNVHMLTKPQFFYDHTTKQALGFQNHFYLKKAQQLEPKLYDGNVIKNTSAIVIPLSEETLLLAEESHFETRFVPQTELSAEQAFWSQNSVNSLDPTLSSRPPKLRFQKNFLKLAWLIRAMEQHRLESKTFEVKMNQVLNENERLLEQVISKDIVKTIVNSSVDIASVNVNECEKCLKLETELLNKKDFVEKEIYDKLFKSFTILAKHCISLEVDTQLNQEIFQRDNSVSNQSAPSFDQLFELNELKAQSHEKFLKTSRALIDVYEGEITLRVGREAITFNLDQTLRYTADYNHMMANRIDVIDMACEEYSQEVLGFSNVISSGNPTPYYDPIVSTSSPTLTPFGDSDFLLFEEADSFLALEDDPTSPEVDPTYYDPEGDILLLEAILNSEPSPPLQGNYFPETRKDLKICEANHENSSVNEPPEVELKDLPPHLEYAFLEGDDKLPVIIAKDLKNEEKAALIEVLKSHKRAIAWKLSDIKGINPEFCTHKILMEEDYEPTVQHQRRVNPKIHDVIKKEVEKLLDAGLIYPISDSPWVSPVHCVPKKGGMTVVKNDENDLIPTRLVTGWRVCIDYRKLNEATRKDHFPLPFMDQMLERLAGNQFYCFLDGFSGYFQIPIDPKDQEKTTFTCPYGTFAYRRMPFGLCNAPGTFQIHVPNNDV